MGRFRTLFSRSSKNEQPQTFSDDKAAASQGSGVDIISLPAAGMQRSSQASFVLSHTANAASRTSTKTSNPSDMTASSHTAVDNIFSSKHGESHWQGKPQGKAYDKREEMSTEDEDMWAKMAIDRYDDPNHPRNNPAYQPDSLKQNQGSQQSEQSTSAMDGDHSAKTMDKGANAASNVTDMSDGLHEDAKQAPGAGQKETGHGTSMFDANQGTIGAAFHKDGTIGQIGEKIGGPLASDGMIGKNFNPDGAIGGTFQKLADKNQEH